MVVDIDDKYPLIVPIALPSSNSLTRNSVNSGDVNLRGSTLLKRHHVNHAAHLDCTICIVPFVLDSSMFCITLSLYPSFASAPLIVATQSAEARVCFRDCVGCVVARVALALV